MGLALLLGVFVLGLAIGLPVAVTLGLSSMVYLLFAEIPLVVIPQKMYAGMDSFVLLCIPGFILAGNLMNSGGITERIIRFANALVGWMRGGLAQANIAASMLFGGISGTAVADVASVGGMMIPGMKKGGLSRRLLGSCHGRLVDRRADDPAERADDHRGLAVGPVGRQAVPCRCHPRPSDGVCDDGNHLFHCKEERLSAGSLAGNA